MMNLHDKKILLTIKKSLPYAAVVVAALTPYIYLLGLAYYQGYMSAFGVSADAFPKSTADIYVEAYSAIGLMMIDLIKLPITILVSAKFYGFLLLFTAFTHVVLRLKDFFNSYQPPEKARTFILKVLKYLHFKNNIFSMTIAYISILTYLLIIFFYILVLVLIFWWGLPNWALKKGESVAIDQIKIYIKKGCFFNEKTNWNACIFMVDKDNKVVQEGLFIAQNANDLAMFKNDGSYIFSIDDDILIRKNRN